VRPDRRRGLEDLVAGLRDELVRVQSPAGSWSHGRESQMYGDALTTGFALQVLQIERCYSPILQGRDN